MRKSFQPIGQVTELNQAIIGQFHYYLCSIDCSKDWCIHASHPLSKKNHILYNAQYGFRANCSTQQAILDIVNRMQSNWDAGLYSCGVFIDLKRAFDTVDHTIYTNYANWVTTVYVELSMIGSRRIWLIGPRLLNLKLAFLAKGK